jgi:tRNA G37 N-methylase TrmD
MLLSGNHGEIRKWKGKKSVGENDPEAAGSLVPPNRGRQAVHQKYGGIQIKKVKG